MPLTVKQLRDILDIHAKHDDEEVQIWLPGSRIVLNGPGFFCNGKVLIEGNVTPGSALETSAFIDLVEAEYLARGVK